MPKRDPQIDAHLEWIGYVRPTGLVVSAPALVRAGAVLPRDPEGQRRLQACVAERRLPPDGPDELDGEPEPWLPDFRTFAASVLGSSFSPKGYAGTDESPIPPDLETPLHDGGEMLRPDFAVRERDPGDGESQWQLLVQVLEPGDDFDRVASGAGRLEVSAHGRMERLLRQTGAPAGLLSNGRTLRLVSAPRGESSGWLDLHVADMATTAGRPIAAALRLLLSEQRLLARPRDKRFAALLADSRRFQNEVSERLAEQVLHALYELLRGVQAADDASDRELLREVLAEHPDDVYHALLTVILRLVRLVFLLYAEERDLLPAGETFARHYSLAGLWERLREDAALHPDTMNQRYGAWAQLLVLFRLFHDGAEADGLRLPPRLGVLFDPDRFPVPRRPPGRRGAPGPRAHRAAVRSRRRRPPRPRQAAGARRRAHLVPRPRRGADRLGLRDDDGVPHRDGDGALGGHQGAEEARRADHRRPRGPARRGGEPAREVAARPDRPRAHRPGTQAGGRGAQRRRPPSGTPAATTTTSVPT